MIVFSNSIFVRGIERYGPNFYFPKPDYHIIQDSAFPISNWLMTPYRHNENLGRMEKYYNYSLSSDRVAVENIFAFVKRRWR
ncbi:hypothetical protein NQ314_017981 [Rhamnusium bicolor]|uniref:DDE Tnp4 domain-containing protein n=1 Tax=Rhamnusium bicolor TaxID=1586634 RepID=A0AAV8WSD0_9CUCU|nr:hypothetical protein NQ314_017981 [Rhamnusium bicolor]